jgi:hypothetical protein
MNRSPSSRTPGGKIKPGGQKTNRHHPRDEPLTKVMPSEGKACIDGPKRSKAKPDSGGAHLPENSTMQTRSACFASMPLGNVDFRLLIGIKAHRM